MLLTYLNALQTLLIIMLIFAFVYIVRKAIQNPAQFAQSAVKKSGELLLQYNTIAQDMVSRGYDETLGRIPVIGPTVSNVAKAATLIPSMPLTKPWEITSQLIAGNPSGAWNALKSTPGEAYHLIANIF